MQTRTLHEPLEDSWKRARQLASQHCGDCGWYHGLWQYLRLVGMGKTLSGQSDWFLGQIRRYRDRKTVSVLISGCADYSAFAHVIAGLNLGRPGQPPEARIVAVDRCQTPLELNQLLAGTTGVPIVNCRSDILDFDSDERFDLIITSSFLGYFDPAQRVTLGKKYFSLLAPGGEFVSANRIRSQPENMKMRLSEDAIGDAVRGALEQHRASTFPDKMDEQEFEARIREYVRHGGSYPVNSADSLGAMLREAGMTDFSIEARMPDLPQDTVALHGHGLAERVPYLCFIARRPAR